MVKLAIVGGGGFRVPLVHGALAAAGEEGVIRELALFDADADRLATIGSVLAARPADGLRVTRHDDLDTALRGADFVFCAVRVGGTRGRVLDERVALDCGVLGQETTGAGGIAYGLRGVPVLTAIARRIAAVAPRAWVVNFTNPVGVVTEAMAEVLGERVIGICDSPSALLRRTAWLIGVAEEEVRFDYVGLNHLGWLRAAHVAGVDRLPALLDGDRLGRIEEGRLFGASRLRELGMIPNEYLQYYYDTAAAIDAATAGPTRGEVLDRRQGAFYARAAAEPARAGLLWREELEERERTYSHARAGVATGEPAGGGYEIMALELMHALAGRGPADLVLDVPAAGAFPDVAPDAVVELPCRVDVDGVRPLPVAPLTGDALDLLTSVKAVERMTVEAARTRSRALASAAFAAHPLVGDAATADRLTAGYGRVHPQLDWLS